MKRIVLAALSIALPLSTLPVLAADNATESVERQRVLHQISPRPTFLQPMTSPAPSSVFGQCVTWNGVSYGLSSNLTTAEAQAFTNSLPPLSTRRYTWSGQFWQSTAVDGPVVLPGKRITLTWSLVPDGTELFPPTLIGTEPSILFSTMNTAFGSQPFWRNIFTESFNDWGDLIGVDYVEVPDDGAPMGAPGLIGVRGDVRIGMLPIDTLGGILAYNFFPLPDDYVGAVPPGTGGDMVIDSQDIALWSTDLGDGFMALRNVIRHEHGHGLGFNHVDPLNQTKLMEALLSTAIDGPQEDDIRGAQRFYGDWLETNSVIAEATPLGSLPNSAVAGPLQIENLAIENFDSIDLFRFEVPNLAVLKYDISPVGTTYLSGPQNEVVAPVDGLRGNDLAADILLSDGVTVVATLEDFAIGEGEVGSYPLSAGAGEYLLRVRSSSSNAEVQRYALGLSYTTGSPNAEWEALGFQLDDSSGNGSGRLDPGETGVRITVPVRNIGFGTGTDLLGSLISQTPTVTIRNSTAVYGTGVSGQTLLPSVPFIIDVDPLHVCGDPVVLLFESTSPDGDAQSTQTYQTGFPGVGAPVDYRPLGTTQIRPGDFTASRIAVADSMMIAKVRLTGIDVTYPQMQDLILYLQSPSGTLITLSLNSLSGPNLRGTTFSDSATTAISQGTSPYTGEFIADGSFSELIGEEALGFWDFGVLNLLGSQSGRIDTWTLEITPVSGTACDEVPEVSSVESISIF